MDRLRQWRRERTGRRLGTVRRVSYRPPWFIWGLAGLGLALLVVPLLGLLWRTPWREIVSLSTSDTALDALRLSLISSFAAAGISLVLGVPLAWVLARTDFPGRAVVRGLVLLPLVLPPVVGGAALLFALGRQGWLGSPLFRATGLVLPFSMGGVVIAAVFVSLPLMVITVEGALSNLNPRYEQAAASLGAGRGAVLGRVALPMIAPAVLAGLALTWARALGEFGATITFAGSLPGRTQTLPLAVYAALESDRGTAVALSLILVVISLVVLILLRDRWWRSR